MVVRAGPLARFLIVHEYNPMTEYELFYLIGRTKKDAFRTIDADVHAIVETHGGTWLEKQVVEERKLAYPIKHETHGLYIAQRFTLPDRDECDETGTDVSGAIAAITNDLKLHTGVLRALIVRADDLPPLMTKDEKDALRIKKQQERERRKNTAVSASETEQQVDEVLQETTR